MNSIVGTKWKAVVNGKKALNGARYSATCTGEVTEAVEGEHSIYDVCMNLAMELEERNAEMTLPDSIQITIVTPNHP